MSRAAETPPARSRSTQETTDLLRRAKDGDRSALEILFSRHFWNLKRWAHGRLPAWARGAAETADLVQDVLLNAFRRVDHFESRGKGALEAYLRQCIHNRIRDELRSVTRRPVQELEGVEPADCRPSPFDSAVSAENRRRYAAALTRLGDSDRELVVGALELGYTYAQLALALHKPSADAARVAVRRAIARLADEMDRD